MDLIKTDSKPDVARSWPCFPCSSTLHTNVSFGTHSSGCCTLSRSHCPGQFHFPTSVRELRYMLVSHVPEDLDSCSVPVLVVLGKSFNTPAACRLQQKLGILTVRGGCTGSGPCLPLSSQPTSLPHPIPILFRHLHVCVHAQSCQLFWDPMELLAALQICQTCFCLEDLYCLPPASLSSQRPR